MYYILLYIQAIDEQPPDDAEGRRVPLRRFLLKLVLAVEGTPLFPTDRLRPWAPKVNECTYSGVVLHPK